MLPIHCKLADEIRFRHLSARRSRQRIWLDGGRHFGQVGRGAHMPVHSAFLWEILESASCIVDVHCIAQQIGAKDNTQHSKVPRDGHSCQATKSGLKYRFGLWKVYCND